MSLFSAEGFEWLRKHPLTASIAAAAAAAYSFAKYRSTEVEEKAEHTDSSTTSCKTTNTTRGIRWGDEDGGALTEVMNVDEGESGMQGSTESFGSDSSSEVESDTAQNQDGTKTANVRSGESSPNFGWYISLTPPQRLYIKSPKKERG